MAELKKLQVTEYRELGKLPDPFVFQDGTPVRTREDWRRRRQELIATAVELQYGTMPPQPEFVEVEPLNRSGPGRIETFRIHTGTRACPFSFTMTVHRPNTEQPCPALVDGDQCYPIMNDLAVTNLFTQQGILVAKFNRCEIVPDMRGIARNSPIYRAYPEYTFRAIGAWAWGYSRCVDALLQLGLVDEKCIAFTGLSRGGKTALVAGALDERATIVNPEAPCAGGSCYRIAMRAITEDGVEARSEELDDIVRAFPDWMGPDLPAYAGRAAQLPFDEHELKALVAPRVLFDSEAKSDIWANPLGAYQSNIAAREVYRFLGAEENLLWYWREGYHAQTMEDFSMLQNLMLNRIQGAPLSDKFMNVPFDAPAPAFDWRCPEGK